MRRVRCRPFRAGDEDGILALYRVVFDLDMSLRTWRWTYEQLPHGPAIIVVAESDQGLVGHYAVQPRPFLVRGKPCLAGLAVGTMIHPSARDVKTLVEMARLAYEICDERGLAFLYAFPNDQAFRIRRSLLGWEALSPLTEWEGAPPPLREQRPSAALTQSHFHLDGTKLPYLSNDILSGDAICGRRDREWVKWRFFTKPAAEYTLHLAPGTGDSKAYAVSKRFERGGLLFGHIVDWQLGSADPAMGRGLMEAVWEQFHGWQVARVSCWALPRTSLCKHLRDAGLRQVGGRTNFVYRALSHLKHDNLASFENWSIHMADSDAY